MAILFMPHNGRLDYAVKGMQAFHGEHDLIVSLKKRMSNRCPDAEFFIGKETLLGNDHRVGWKHEKYVCFRSPDDQVRYVGTCDVQTFLDFTPEEALKKSLDAYHDWEEEYNRL